jgi:hypothetical protein
MAQVVGRACAICGERIGTVSQGGFCRVCRSPVHGECARRAAKGSETCAACGAPERSAEPDPPLAPPRASPAQVRVFAAVVIFCGLVLAFLFSGYEFAPSRIPVPWLGYFAVGMGLCMLAIPSAFEGRVSRLMRPDAKWIPAPPPARAASQGAAPATFEGMYGPPLFASEQRPFPLRGKGSLAIHARGIEVSGTRLLYVSAPGFVLIAVAIPAVGAATFLLAGVWGLAALVGLVIAMAVLLRLRQRQGTIAIPWENVQGFLGDPKGRFVRIMVRKMRPKGEIWFAPADGQGPVLAALVERGATRESGDLGL